MKLLVTALDWGLGHASRLCEIIAHELEQGNEVVLAGSGRSLSLLQQEFPRLKSLPLKSFSPWFFRRLPQWLAISLQVPNFIYRVIYEQKATEEIVSAENIDKIISDNRYGVRSAKCRNILVTHQTMPIVATWAPQWLNRLFAKCLSVWINKFDEVWIPDIAPCPDGLVGSLSDTRYVSAQVKVIGVKSRLLLAPSSNAIEPIDVLAIVSGPEPQRTEMELRMVNLMRSQPGRRIIIRGVTDNIQNTEANSVLLRAERSGIEFYDHLDAKNMRQMIENARLIYCRSGYSTIMDLWALKRRARITPTVGQAEQEYIFKKMLYLGFEKM